jgi:hypothetical protein
VKTDWYILLKEKKFVKVLPAPNPAGPDGGGGGRRSQHRLFIKRSLRLCYAESGGTECFLSALSINHHIPEVGKISRWAGFLYIYFNPSKTTSQRSGDRQVSMYCRCSLSVIIYQSPHSKGVRKFFRWVEFMAIIIPKILNHREQMVLLWWIDVFSLLQFINHHPPPIIEALWWKDVFCMLRSINHHTSPLLRSSACSNL